ncbi:MAG: proline--tRNA ligase [Chloroflexi bacterium]|nr:proline--tRNA ligase [Chloroflexota bacterium]
MRVSKMLTRTLKETPAEAETISHKLLLRAGMISQLVAGVYTYLPLAWRVLRKIEDIVRAEMDAAGGQELSMPVLQPLDLWQKSGRDVAFGKGLFNLTDRRERKLVLGPTHEEVITQLVSQNVRSYRDLPLMPYQMQTKFRDEPRARGGLLRGREFLMKDLYSFDADEAGLARSYDAMLQAYHHIYSRCGLPALAVEADSGAIGGKASHEFMVIAESGEDEIIRCNGCGYAANVEKAEAVKGEVSGGAPLLLEEVATPGAATIEEVSAFLKVPPQRTLKAVFYMADGQLVFAVIRGDLDVNEVKLKNNLRCTDLRMASEAEVNAAGIVAGAASPVKLSGVRVVADDSITSGTNFIAGGNRPETHLRNVNYPRDFSADIIADIARARAGQGCARCGGSLSAMRGIEVGHVFKLGTFLSEKLGAFFVDEKGESRPIIMGCYGIGLGRMLAAAIEQNHDDKGIIWPLPIAPYQVYLCPLYREGSAVAEVAEKIYNELTSAGVEVLFDDRVESPGVKFNDADLLGIPLRVTISPRTLDKNSAEMKWRRDKESSLAPLEGIAGRGKGLINERMAGAQV